jgi:hypothetical protein
VDVIILWHCLWWTLTNIEIVLRANVGLCRKNCWWMWLNIGTILSANVGLFRSAFVKSIVGGCDQTSMVDWGYFSALVKAVWETLSGLKTTLHSVGWMELSLDSLIDISSNPRVNSITPRNEKGLVGMPRTRSPLPTAPVRDIRFCWIKFAAFGTAVLVFTS